MRSAYIAAMIAQAIGNTPQESPNASLMAPDVRIMIPPRHVYCPMTTPRKTSAATTFPNGMKRTIP